MSLPGKVFGGLFALISTSRPALSFCLRPSPSLRYRVKFCQPSPPARTVLSFGNNNSTGRRVCH